MPDPNALKMCLNCTFGDDGGFSASDVIAILAAAISLISAFGGIQAFVVADRAQRNTILRDEFAGHRLRLDAALMQIERELSSLRQASHPRMPLTRVEQVFIQSAPTINRSMSELETECDKIHRRTLFGPGWATVAQGKPTEIETHFDVVSDVSNSETARRSSSVMIVVGLEAVARDVQRLIDDFVKSPLEPRVFNLPRWIAKFFK